MKEYFKTSKNYFLTALSILAFCMGCNTLYENFGKTDGNEQLYPLFLQFSLLFLIYIIPLAAFIYYLAKRFKVSNSILILSSILGLTGSVALSEIGHIAIGYFWLFIVKADQTFLADWGASLSAPFAEEFAKGLMVLLVLLLLKQWNVKSALVSGMVVGLGFQIIEDSVFLFRSMFISNTDGFQTVVERLTQAAVTHWLMSALFAVGLVALLKQTSQMSRKQGLFWLSMGVLTHFLFNSPFEATVLYSTLNLCLFAYLLKIVWNMEKDDTTP